MKPLRILITGAGAPGCPSILNCLRNNGERDLYIVGVDMNPLATCRSMVEEFYRVPAASDPSFVDCLVDICKAESIDALISIVTRELEPIALAKKRFEAVGTKICVMDYEPLHVANNKGLLLTAMRDAGLPTPAFEVVDTPESLERAVLDLGYPEVPVVVKPTFGNGSRGTRILDETISRYERFFNEKPNSSFSTLHEVMSIVSERGEIPEMMAMEYLPGMEVSVDILADHGETIYSSCRQGVVVSSIMVSSELRINQEAVDQCKEVAHLLKLDGPSGFDMKLNSEGRPRLMEINPRLPAGISLSVAAGINFPYLRVKQVLGEKLPTLEVVEGYTMQFRNEEVLYEPDGSVLNWRYWWKGAKTYS